MSYEFEDTETLAIDSDWLSVFEPGQFCSSSKRPVTRCKNLFWWIECYPNGDSENNKQNVSVFVWTSAGGFESTQTVAVLRSDIEHQSLKYRSNSCKEGWSKAISHDMLQLGNIIKNGVYTIQCNVIFKIPKETINTFRNLEASEHSYIVKLNRKLLETCPPGHRITEKLQTVGDRTWWIEYFPCGDTAANEEYVSIYVYVTGSPVGINISIDMSIGDVVIQRSDVTEKTNSTLHTSKFLQLFSHKQCLFADHKSGIIDLVCRVKFSKLPLIVKEISSYEFKDTDTIPINADWLDFFEPGFCFSTSPRAVPWCENLFWWMQCYPNGFTQNNKQHVSIYVCTSVGGFKLTQKVTIHRSNVEYECTKFRNKSMNWGWSEVISHDELRRGDIVENGTFAIQCDVRFDIPAKTIENLRKLEPFEDNFTIKFDLKMFETYKPGHEIIEEEQTVGGVTWWINYYPCGKTVADKDYVSVNFNMTGGPVRMRFVCAISIGGVLVQLPGIHDFEETCSRGHSQCFSHELCKLADHKDGIIDIACEIQFYRSTEPMPRKFVEQKPSKVSVTDSITVTLFEYQLNHTGNDNIITTMKKFVNGSDKHQWQLLYFPAGDGARARGCVSMTIEASTTETKTVILSGVIKIVGTVFQKQFNMIVEKDGSLGFTKLISHEMLQQIGGIIHHEVTIICDATFHTLNDLRLNWLNN